MTTNDLHIKRGARSTFFVLYGSDFRSWSARAKRKNTSVAPYFRPRKFKLLLASLRLQLDFSLIAEVASLLMYFLIFHIMQNSFSRHHLDYVSHHFNQTHLVTFLFTISDGFCFEDIEGSESETEVYQWLVFPRFSGGDLERLIAAKIPVIDSEYGCWVGITSFGSHYDLYVYPDLINALFGIDCSYRDIEKLRGF